MFIVDGGRENERASGGVDGGRNRGAIREDIDPCAILEMKEIVGKVRAGGDAGRRL
jgi:hypothetical protein